MGGRLPGYTSILIHGGKFQSTPPHGGGDFLYCLVHLLACGFNPRPRMGGDPLEYVAVSPTTGFNPRPRMGGDCFTGLRYSDAVFQSTPPHGGRRLVAEIVAPVVTVSIHAPAWGATWRGWFCCLVAAEFQSTPPHGGRQLWRVSLRWREGFNPRPRMGGDLSSSRFFPCL